VLLVGTLGILIAGVQPIVLAALLNEKHITLAQLGHASTSELLSMGGAAALAGALLPARHIRAIGILTGLLLAVGNWFTPLLSGESVTAMRVLTGAAGGVLIWVTSCLISRSATPDRWAGIWLAVQTLTQLLFGFGMSLWVEPQWGAAGDFHMLVASGLLAALCALWLPAAFVDLPRRPGAESSLGIPSPLGMAGLAVAFLFMMFIVTIWVYYEPLAHQAGLSSQVSEHATLISLA
jgi:hypothetical protein